MAAKKRTAAKKRARPAVSRPVRRAPRRAAGGGIATTRRALVDGLHHVYLPDNHLDWWTAVPPPAGVVAALQQERYRALLREFHATIATVVGGDVAAGDRVDPFNLIAETGIEGDPGDGALFELYPTTRGGWHALAPASRPSAEFRVRHAILDGSAPRFADIRFAGDRTDRRHVIVTADRSSIWLDFVVPQRAVGVQTGFAGGPARGLDRRAFRLEAWRGDGSAVATTTGDDLTKADWQPRRVELLALRDDRGGIRTVRLSCSDPGFAAAEFLFLYRVWHEALPAAVVRQGTVVNFPLAVFRGHQHPDHPDLPPRPPAGVADPAASTVETFPTPDMAGGMFSHDSVELTLPLGCDRAAVFLRGFKFIPGVQRADYRAPQPQKFSKLYVRLEETLTPGPGDPRIRFRIRGEYRWGEEDEEREFGLRAAYWTVLAWRSDRAELFRSAAAGASNQHHRKDGNSFEATHDRPLADPAAVRAAGPEGVYGQLFGGLTSYNLTLPRPVEPQIHSFAIGSYGGEFPPDEFFEDEARPPWEYIISGVITSGSVGVAGIIGLTKLIGTAIREAQVEGPIAPLSAPLSYNADGSRIGWSFVTNLNETLDRDERATTSVSGTVLTGRSLSCVALAKSSTGDAGARPAVRVVELIPDALARENPLVAPFNVGSLEVQIPADQAIAVMGTFDFFPEDEVRELDVEVRAAHFDGERLLVALGSGVEIEGAIRDTFEEPDVAVGGGGWSSDLTRRALAIPHVAGIRRAIPATRIVLATGHAEFAWIDGTRDDLPQAPGYLRNDGNLPIGVRALRVDGPGAAAFYLRLRHRGVEKFLDRFVADLPLTLMPGEAIELLGAFSPAALPVPPPRVARAWLTFAFASRLPDVEIQAFASRARVRGVGYMFPPFTNFGNVRTPVGPRVLGGDSRTVGDRSARTPAPAHAVSRPFAVYNANPDPLVIRSMTVTPRGTGLTFHVTDRPWNIGGLHAVPPALYVLEPGTHADFLLTWAPSRLGRLNARLTIETNGVPLTLEIVGEAIAES